MNEAWGIIAYFGISFVAIFLFTWMGRSKSKRSGISRDNSNNGSARNLNERAGHDNREIAEDERRSADVIREQAAEIERTADNNRDAANLIKRGKEILNSHHNTE